MDWPWLQFGLPRRFIKCCSRQKSKYYSAKLGERIGIFAFFPIACTSFRSPTIELLAVEIRLWYSARPYGGGGWNRQKTFSLRQTWRRLHAGQIRGDCRRTSRTESDRQKHAIGHLWTRPRLGSVTSPKTALVRQTRSAEGPGTSWVCSRFF